MSHATVLVIGDDVVAALAPYDENIPVESYVETDGLTYTRNPNAKWDWWVEGGRWENVALIRYDGKNVTSCKRNELDLEAMSMRAEGLWYPFALVVDGVWHERATLGWWATEHNETMDEDEWSCTVAKMLAAAPPDATLTLVDFHI